MAQLKQHLRQPTTAEATKKALAPLFEVLAAASVHEQLPSPDEYARIVGERSMPLFVEFDDDSRTLKSEYPFGGDGTAAFRNFCALAGINVAALRRAHQAGDSAGIKEILEGAETRLAEKLTVEWSQATKLRVGLDRDQAVMKLNVKSEGGKYHALGDRSDGLRTFIALRAFLAQRRTDRPIALLVDEAETHLHYDAQADLVRVFEGQRDAQQVIYTTHSIGCLPQDLGRGVRAVVPDQTTHASTLDDAWTRTHAGVAPLMAAIGAASIRLTPTRHIVIGEGASDALLLPSLIREANALRALPFQVVSGFAEASEEELRRLAKETEHVAFLADGDDGGEALVRFALNAGITKGRIVQYGARLCLEDLVDADLYLRALNSCFAAWGKPARMTAGDLPASGRPSAVRDWCRANGVKEDGKLDVTQEVIRLYQADDSPSRRIVDPTRQKSVQQLYKALIRAVRISLAEARSFSA